MATKTEVPVNPMSGLEPDPAQATDPSPTPNNSQSDGSTTVTPVDGAFNFTNPRLAGRTPQEIEALFATLDATVQEQGRTLNRLSAQPVAPTPVVQPSAPAPVTKEAFWEDPGTVVRRQVQEALAPLQAEVNEIRRGFTKQEVESGRDRLRKSHDDFDFFEPYIDNELRNRNIDPATAEEPLLETLYYAALGMATKKFNYTGKPKQQDTPVSTAPTPVPPQPPMPPQHRPSSAPMPVGTGQRAPARRELNENEKRLAREYFGKEKDPEGAYLAWQEADETEVVNFEYKPGV